MAGASCASSRLTRDGAASPGMGRDAARMGCYRDAAGKGCSKTEALWKSPSRSLSPALLSQPCCPSCTGTTQRQGNAEGWDREAQSKSKQDPVQGQPLVSRTTEG